MQIGPIDLDKEILVIAEVGNNHEGDFELAKRLVRLAAEAGAGAVKFQTIVPGKLVSPADTARVAQLSRFQFSYEQFAELAETARENGILFLSTPFDLESARFLDSIVPAYKIASGDNTFFPLLEVVARTGKPIILSVGLMDLDEVRRTQEFIEGIWAETANPGSLVLLHCVVNYPTAPEHANLLSIRDLQQLGTTVGYSDHVIGIDAAVLSVALGARVIEKHFTIDKNYSEFRDHQLSADPAELAELCRRVKETAVLLGEPVKRFQENEREIGPRVRRSIVAAHDLEAGKVLAWEDLSWVRPGGGLAPGQEAEVVGKTLAKPLQAGEMISLESLA